MSSIFRKYMLTVILVVLVGAAAYYVYFSHGNNSVIYEEGIMKGYLVTDVEMLLLDGRSIRFSDYEGEVIILDFMAPWCTSCREQLLVLKEVVKKHDVQVISVNIDPSYDSSYLRRFEKSMGVIWNFGTSTEAALTYQTNAIPTILFIDKEGVIRYRGFFTTLLEFDQLMQKYG